MGAQDQITREVKKWSPNLKRPLGSPRQRWIDRVKSDLHILGVINGEELAHNREAWRDVVVAAKGLNGLY